MSSAVHGTISDECMMKCSKALLLSTRRNRDHFLELSTLISCVQNGQRLFRVDELEAAFQIFSGIAFFSRSVEYNRKLFVALMTQPDSIFETNPSGRVIFRDPDMRTFLRNSEIKGIDLSHTLLSGICESVLTHLCPTKQSFQINDRLFGGGIVAYAQQYWQFHSVLAEIAGRSSDFDLGSEADEVVQQMSNMNLIASDEDWILIELDG